VLGKTIDPTDLAAVQAAAQDERVKKAVLDELERIGKASKFNSYERVRKVHLEIEPFTIENELLTPT
jgi:long-chain acyl-CoA synthetase